MNDDNGITVAFADNNNTDSFNLKEKITGQTGNNSSTSNVEVIVSLKYFSNFWRYLI